MTESEEGQNYSSLTTDGRSDQMDDQIADNQQTSLEINDLLVTMENNESNCVDGLQSIDSAKNEPIETTSSDENEEKRIRDQRNSESMAEFKAELLVKREQRQNAIADMRNEILNLREQLAAEKELNIKLMAERNASNRKQALDDDQNIGLAAETDETIDEKTPSNSNSIALQTKLAEAQFSLQIANAEILSLNSELSGTKKQVTSLKEVISVTKQMVEIRENQLEQVSNSFLI